MAGMSRREQVAWVLVFGLPPGIGITGFVSVMFEQGAITARAVGAGLLTALVLGGFVAAALYFGPDEPENDTPDAPGERARE